MVHSKMKKPFGPEDVVEVLRERIKREDLTLTASDAVRIILMLERLSQRCAEAYQVVGSLAGLAEVMDDPAVQKALDLFSRPTRPGDVLPFITQRERQRVVPKRRSKAKSSPKTAGKKVGRKSRS
ncbi:MAG: hypothetical protein WCF13_11210 [Stellaceae bacterium]